MSEAKARQAESLTYPPVMYGVVLDLPPAFSKEIVEKRSQLNDNAQHRLFPHVTLRAPFTTDHIKDLFPALEDVARNFLPVRIKARGLSAFAGPRNNVLYVPVERTEELQRLHEALVGALEGVEDVFPYASSYQFENWAPHVTIIDRVPREWLDDLRARLRDYEPHCEWDATEFLLVRSKVGEGGSIEWITTRSFPALD